MSRIDSPRYRRKLGRWIWKVEYGSPDLSANVIVKVGTQADPFDGIFRCWIDWCAGWEVHEEDVVVLSFKNVW